MAGTIGGGVLFTVVFALVMTPVFLRCETLRQAQAMPRPRWQYLVISAGWMVMAGGFAAASLMLGPPHPWPAWLARACGGFGAWFAVFGLGMLGRAVCWGRIRNLFWWRRPLWTR